MSEEEKKENQQGNEEEVKDFFSQIMFGARNSVESETKSTVSPAQQDQEQNSNQIMSQLDDIYTSIQDLKPAIREFSPIIEFLKKKFKL